MSAQRQYEAVPRRDRDEVERLLRSEESDDVVAGLCSACRYEEDWRWLQQECLKRITDPNVPVRWAAVTCLGDLAWHRRFPLEKDLVVPALEAACEDREIADPARFSLSLVKEFA